MTTLSARVIWAAGLMLVAGCDASADELPLSRVVLSTAGLAQFTHVGQAGSGAAVDLQVRLDQVDDVLKSLAVFDKEGAVGAVSLPGKAPLAELFRDLPFGPDALASPAALLNAMVGSEVEMTGKVSARGRVLRVQAEQVALPDRSGTVTQHRLTLVTDAGLVQGVIEEAASLRFVDAQVRAQIERALAGSGENRAKERRRLSIGFLGRGNREVAISYVVAAPVWKAAYRLVMPKESGRARLQGWAVVENLTGGDWKDVDLVLVSGNPVALRQPLYTAFFVDRPEVPVVASARLMPRTDDAREEQSAVRAKAAPGMATRSASVAQPLQSAQAQRLQPLAAGSPNAPSYAAEALGAAAQAAEAEEGATQLSYSFPAKVSLSTGSTMMVPFLDREVAATREWLYQPETSPRRPLAAIRVRNDGESGLPPGIVTAYDSSRDGNLGFVGDAQLPLLPKGMFKFVTFALDVKTDIRRDDNGVNRVVSGKAVNGVLTLTTRSRRTIAYEIIAPADEDRDIFIEELRSEGWQAVGDGGKSVEETPTVFRYKVSAAKGSTTKAALRLERTDSETVVLTSLAPEEILARIRGVNDETPALKEAVAKLGAVVADINKARAERGRLDAERKSTFEDQTRLRANLQAVGAGSDAGRQYVEKLKTQETRLAEITARQQEIDREITAKHAEAEKVAKQMTL